MFKKILIANRGEIACRVAATARRMGVKTVAVYSDADANAKHVACCDEALHIGASAPKDSYLQWERILAAAKQTGADAIHPGYGFLSENDAFATACTRAGLVFIGPPAAAILAMGLKAESKRLMSAAGVPLVPGYHGADQDAALLQREADAIGYPVLIKASAGGGGKGMRIVDKAADFAAALASCKREATSSFGNDSVLIEKYVQRPRHIEIQVFGDTHGNCVYLFERDCSVQRRHQKVLEEAPAPGLSPSMREAMGAAAVAAAKAVNYVGAGTVEFIVEQSDGAMKFFFMEMNTRLQVEHPVTEAITGLDLVEWQLRVASGEPLPLAQHQLHMTGHAIEARICAESPDHNFLPATGTLSIYRHGAHESFTRGTSGRRVRVDSGVREGDTISPFYDSMIAKLIVHGDTREHALALLDKALSETHIVGLQTNVQFLRHVIASDSFAEAHLDTALIERERARLFHQHPVANAAALDAAVAHILQQEKAWEADDPLSKRDAWRAYGEATRRFDFEIGDSLETISYKASELVALQSQAQQGLQAIYVKKGESFDEMHIFMDKGAAVIKQRHRLSLAVAQDAHAGGGLNAPMPGKVVSFDVKAGDKVSKGQRVAVMEAMKMEHAIIAPADGVVGELLYAAGEQVAEGAALLHLIGDRP
ncbi:MAG: acetyl/propionyl/methylcrotonyl-CoA carboxylase subunit alpha [Cytophagales bacterium]|nr:acetyl/propionyl/methylcrotonyl-CoA carboxylase subunit alpha [Cytophagales bacterium]